MKHIMYLLGAVTLTANVAFAGNPFPSVGMTNNNDNTANSTSLATGTVANSQVFEGSTPAPYLPGNISAPILSPTLFSLQGLPAQVAGLPLLSKNYFSISTHDVCIGSSSGTKIIYNGSIIPARPKRDNRTIFMNVSGVAQGEIVGSITVQSRKHKADEVDVSTLLYDATRYIDGIKGLKGYDLTLLTVKNTFTYAVGVDARSSGISLTPLLSGFINGPAGVVAGLASGFSKTGGVTAPTALVGCTFLVLADTERNRLVDLNATYSNPETPEKVVNGNGKKKYEALKNDQ
jgi:hypothetical protein